MGACLSFLTNILPNWDPSTSMIQLEENTIESHPISTCKRFEYDVFLSFRGTDTRDGFTSFLYEALTEAGLEVFLDERKLEPGDDILPRLMEAIENSRLSIPVFSPDYASSKSCLKEVAKMNECRRTRGQIVVPIFYNIEPSHVRKQEGRFKRSFDQHRRDGVDPQDLSKWKLALQATGFYAGYAVKGGAKCIDRAKIATT